MTAADALLPRPLLERATLRGNEYAWPIGAIPDVIEAAKSANLVSIGGQLQFRLTEGGTCECYWVEVDTYSSVADDLTWDERVQATAEQGLRQFVALQNRFDFEAEGRSSFAKHIEDFEADGGNLADAMCFVWYLRTEEEAAGRGE